MPACYWLGKPETLPIPVAGDACCMKPERSGTAVIALKMGWKTGFEPATPGITIRCSNQLSYIHHWGAHSRSPAIKNASLRLHPARPAGIAVFNPRMAVPVRVAVDVGWRLPGPRQLYEKYADAQPASAATTEIPTAIHECRADSMAALAEVLLDAAKASMWDVI